MDTIWPAIASSLFAAVFLWAGLERLLYRPDPAAKHKTLAILYIRAFGVLFTLIGAVMLLGAVTYAFR